MNRAIAVALFAGFALAACSSPAPQIIYVTPRPTVAATRAPTPVPSSHTMTGTLSVTGAYNAGYYGIARQQDQCVPDDGYSDVVQGINVVVKDQSGTVIGASTLRQDDPAFSETDLLCHFVFTVGALPDAPFYVLSLGRREGPTYSASELQTTNWDVALSLGT